ncbi:Acyl transferase domain-containing protein [Actinokineospora alba]|uniref:Acyl transferase domain-containing protein n=1 Tax=Actinokineospora alba TaxID=504798 RepID=A0A1H0QXX0_9PSEU|nr:type I polyketide synthase [Actinokineospora alba]TDP70343.1 acyl transferase domain-containing protein [Actinokineospora alba]SDI33714.1 Acyl transferase domain-containing protein [Actinokineospora alba]SDP22094.1 Acyl transferase domain-containing protein [Actinokineospora alba]
MATEDKLREYLKRVTVDLTEARKRLAEVEETRHEPIAVVGMACRYPGGGDTVESFWDLLRDGRTGVVEVPPSRWQVDDYYDPDRRAVGGVYTRHGSFLPDISGWDAEFFGLSPQEALRMDPQQRLLMELLWEGLENAGTTPAKLAGSRTAVMVGFMDTVQYGRLEQEFTGPGVVADPYFGQGVSASVVAGRLAYQYDLRGPTVTLDTACSSSLVGVHLAAEALRRGECELAVAAGAFLMIHPDIYVQACATSMLAPDGLCKTFDSGADGYVMGEGGGLVVLERLSSAIRNKRRIRAVLRGSAVNQDGRSNGLTAPSRGAQVDVIRRALAAARVRPEEVDYVEAHGSGTQLGDAIELSALHDVFGKRDRPLHVGAVKTNIGHTQSAAGVAGLIKTVLVLENGLVPENLHLSEPAVAIPADGTVQPAATQVRLPESKRIGGVSSFGWSGTNAHLVLESAPEPTERTESAATTHVLPVSATSASALRAQLEGLAGWLEARPDADLADVAHTLQTGRAEHDHRRALLCTDTAEAIRRLSGAASAGELVLAKKRPRVAFLLPGTGDQYLGLGRELYRTEPVYAAAVDTCVEIAQSRSGVDLRPVFFGEDKAPVADDLATMLGRGPTATSDDDPMHQAEIAHPFLFTVEYALAKLLAHWGVTPDLLIGYSLGEYVAACLAGVFSLEDALHVVVERARLISSAPAGGMVAVAADETTVRAAIADSGAEVDVAALNGPSMTVLSGVDEALTAVSGLLTSRGVACRPLRTAHAFHSSLLEPVRDKLAALIDSVPRQAPTTTIVSNHTGAALTAAEATSHGYWADHLVNPVRFADGVRHCLAEDIDVFLELGAGQTLGGLVRQNLTAGQASVLGTLPALWAGRETPDERVELLAACGQLWELGVAVDWAGQDGARIVSLPTYPFQRTRFWPEQTYQGGTATTKRTQPAELCYAPSWRRDVTPEAAPLSRLSGPLVVFADPDGVGTRLAAMVAATGTPVLEVVPGTALSRDGDRMVIDPAEPEHYREVRAAATALADTGPVHVVHTWSLLADSATPVYATDDELRGSIRHAFDSLLLTVQAFAEVPASHGMRLLTVSRGGMEILGADAPAPYRSAGHGLARVVQHEFAGLTWSGVDLDPDQTDDLSATHLGYELARESDPHGTVAGWRRGRRWINDWAEVSTQDNADWPWRADGVYLITGGTRGLGMGLAKHLVRAGGRKLALVSRSGVAPAADVAELEAAGAEVLTLAADVGVPDQLRAALRSCREHFGELTGVLHVAGLPASGMAQRQTIDGAGAVLAPKILAMGPLAELVGPDSPVEERPELLVLYSSAVTAFGGIGEGDYCAANTVLDAYGSALAATAPSTRVVTVAWGPWLHDAWQDAGDGSVSDLAERASQYRQKYGFSDEAGNAFLDRVVGRGHGSVLAVRQPMAEALREWTALVDIDALVNASFVAPAGERFPRPLLRTEFVAPRTDLETTIAEVWQAYLGIDRVGVNDPFFDLGGNSLVGMAMVRAVEKELDSTIAPAVLFEHPTVAAFAAALDRPDGPDQTSEQVLATSSARGQRRRRARSDSRK